MYSAPDAHVLLSVEFANAYCFRVARQERDSLVGITFEPSQDRGPAAVRGTLWLHARTYEARHLEYGYTRAELPARSGSVLGGRVEFARLPAGTWIVRNWYIRMPAELAEQRVSTGIGPDDVRQTLVTVLETGGEVLDVVASGTRVTTATLATVSGVVYDSAATDRTPSDAERASARRTRLDIFMSLPYVSPCEPPCVSTRHSCALRSAMRRRWARR